MKPRRPGSATAAGILAIIYGSLFSLCGLCGLASLAAQGAMGNNIFAGNDPVAEQFQKALQEALARDVPAYQAYQIAGTTLGLILALLLLTAGIGILNMQRWARKLALIVGTIALLSTLFQAVYQTVFVVPAMTQAFETILPAIMAQGGGPEVPKGGGPKAAQVLRVMETMGKMMAVGTVILYVVIIIYLSIIVLLLRRRHVRAAFANPDQAGREDRPTLEERGSHGDENDQDWDQPPPSGDPKDDWRIR